MKPLTFRLFLTCLFVCATMIIGGIWFDEHIHTEVYFKTAATFFIIGLTSFLLWVSGSLTALLRMQKSQTPE